MKKLALVLVILLSVLSGCQKEEKTVTINLALAASLETVFEEKIIPEFLKNEPNVVIERTYDGSGKLMAQIQNGLEADIFFSAATKQMNTLKDEGYIEKCDNLLNNKLVLITSKDSTTTVTSYYDILNASLIAIGNPEYVPAGVYAKEILDNLNIEINDRFTLGSNVTEVLKWVESGDCEVGIVYSTDAMSSGKVRIICESDSALLKSQIIYPVGLTKYGKDNEKANAFYEFLRSEYAVSVFKEYGFSIGE